MVREKTKSKYKYRGDDDPEIIKRHAESSGDYDKLFKDKFVAYKPPEGKNRVRILPRTWDGDPRHWAYPVYVHYDVGPDNGMYLCLKKLGKGDCPVCEERIRLADDDKEAADKLRPGLRQVAWIIDRDKPDAGPQLFMMSPKSIERPICDLSRDDETGEVLKISHPEKGHDVIFTRTGTKKTSTVYSGLKVRPNASPISNDDAEQNEILEFIEENPIPDCLNVFDYDYISNIFSARGSKKSRGEDEDEEEEDEEYESRSSRSKARAEEEEEEEDDDEPAPRSRRRAEIDDEDEELDEEKPRGKGQREESATRKSSKAGSRGEEKPRRNLKEEVRSGLKKRRHSSDDEE